MSLERVANSKFAFYFQSVLLAKIWSKPCLRSLVIGQVITICELLWLPDLPVYFQGCPSD